MKPKNKFKGRETVRKIAEKTEEFGRLSRHIGVIVEKNRPIFEGKDGRDERGPTQVDVVICRGHSKLSFTAEEAERVAVILGELISTAKDAEKICLEERDAWRKSRDDQRVRYEPGSGRDVMSPGKTQRTRDKKAAKKAAGGE